MQKIIKLKIQSALTLGSIKRAPISAGFINLDGGVVYGGQLLAYCPDTLRYYQSPLENQDAC